MSGDVQPRKRKDKKKLKEDDGYSPINEDVNIHVHKEGGTGGNICAKIVFFLLFSALIVLIGLIIKENQGLSELEEFDSESRYSQIFEGWIDKSIDEHEENHSPELSHEHDDHDLDEDDHDKSEEDSLEESEEEQSDESNIYEQDEDEDSRSKSEEETNEVSEEDDEVTASEEDNTVEEDDEETYGQSESQEKDKDVTEEESENESKADRDSDIEDDEDAKDEEKAKKKSVDDDDEDSTEDKVTDKSDEKRTVLKKDVSKKPFEDVKEASKEVEGKEKIVKESPIEEEPKEEINSESAPPRSGLATKIGVGVALLMVAYNVFFRKRTPEKVLSRTISEKEPTPDLSRRNTLVPPLSLQEVEPDLPDIEGDEEEYSEEDYSDEDSRSEHRSARDEYEELSSNYIRPLKNEDNSDAIKNLEDDILEPEDNINEEELEEEEELDGEELEDEEIEDEYDKYDDDEDEELLKRLEAKYGKLGREVNVGEEAESDSDKEEYEHSNITNKDDFKIKADIDAAQEHLNKDK